MWCSIVHCDKWQLAFPNISDTLCVRSGRRHVVWPCYHKSLKWNLWQDTLLMKSSNNSHILTCLYVPSSTGGAPEETSVCMLRGRAGGHWETTSILSGDRRIYSTQFYLPPSCPPPLIQSEKPLLLSTSQRPWKGKKTIYYLFSVSSLRATFLHLPQGISPTAYLLHRISQPSDWNTEQRHTCDLSLLLPWQPVLPLKLSSLQPWRPAMTLDLLPPASSDPLTD